MWGAIHRLWFLVHLPELGLWLGAIQSSATTHNVMHSCFRLAFHGVRLPRLLLECASSGASGSPRHAYFVPPDADSDTCSHMFHDVPYGCDFFNFPTPAIAMAFMVSDCIMNHDHMLLQEILLALGILLRSEMLVEADREHHYLLSDTGLRAPWLCWQCLRC